MLTLGYFAEIEINGVIPGVLTEKDIQDRF